MPTPTTTSPARHAHDRPASDVGAAAAAFARRLVEQVLERAAEDTDVRARLLADCRPVCDEMGLAASNGRTVALVESDADVTFVLPRAGNHAGELDDATLEQVTGGLVGFLLVCGAVALCGHLANRKVEAAKNDAHQHYFARSGRTHGRPGPGRS